MQLSAPVRSRLVVTALLPLLALGCEPSPRSAAADVPATDVRRLPNERKVGLRDVMMEAADLGRVIGSDSAPVKLMVVSDYQCDSCRIWFETVLPIIRAEYVATGKARLTWVHYPLRQHPAAVRAASAALCSSVQGKFWETSARLFGTQQAWGSAKRPDSMIDTLAVVPGVEAFALQTCLDGERMLRQIRRDIDWTDTVKAGSPLRLLFGTRQLSGATPIGALRAALDSAVSGK